MIDPGLTGRVALVTGGNQGIGAATARALAAQGAAVFITYLRLGNDDPGVIATPVEGYAVSRARSGDEVAAEIVANGGRAAAWEADLTDAAAIPAVLDQAEAALGPVEILVNNADTWQADTFLAATADRFGRGLNAITATTIDHIFSVNSRAAALLIAEYARRHQARQANWGRVISLTTGPAAGFPEEVSYGASKNALESFTVAAAAELGRFGITANIVCPPPTDTGWITPEMAEAFAAQGPLYHVGQPEDVAEVIVLLASEQARYLTGQRIVMA